MKDFLGSQRRKVVCFGRGADRVYPGDVRKLI